MQYAGDVVISECWGALKSETKSCLVDVRTVPEWQFVGVPDLSETGKQVIFAEWQRYPDMGINESFLASVEAALARTRIGKEDKVFMLCRSGVRSAHAAAALTAHGYQHVFNIIGGFEGDPNENGQRATVNGWKFEGAPWRQ